MSCFECGKLAEHNHHVLPESKGGTRTVPLCANCHGLIHDRHFPMGHTNLIKAGLEKRRRRGKRIGRAPLKIDEEMMLSLYKEGKDKMAIARLLGVERGVIHRRLKKHFPSPAQTRVSAKNVFDSHSVSQAQNGYLFWFSSGDGSVN